MRIFFSLLTVAACLLCSVSLQSAEQAGTYTAEGTFVWSHQKGKTHTVKAVFTKGDAKNKFNVKFYFNWGKDQRVYSGTAEGDLKDGSLKGTVKADNQDRTFTFDGACKAAVFSGTHKETTRGTQDTGTITWKPKAQNYSDTLLKGQLNELAFFCRIFR